MYLGHHTCKWYGTLDLSIDDKQSARLVAWPAECQQNNQLCQNKLLPKSFVLYRFMSWIIWLICWFVFNKLNLYLILTLCNISTNYGYPFLICINAFPLFSNLVLQKLRIWRFNRNVYYSEVTTSTIRCVNLREGATQMI